MYLALNDDKSYGKKLYQPYIYNICYINNLTTTNAQGQFKG